MRVHARLFACLTDHLSYILNERILMSKVSIWEGEWRATAASERPWSMHANLCIVYCKLFQLVTMIDNLRGRVLTHGMPAQWLRSLQVRATPNYAPGNQLMIWVWISPCNSSCPDWQQTVTLLLIFMVCVPQHKSAQCVVRSGSPHDAEAIP